MTEEQTISWVYLAIGIASKVTPASFSNISAMADGINHAIPTHKELQSSISWLIKHALAEKKGNKYMLTEKGKSIYHTATDGAKILLQVWNALETQIKELSIAP